jgi:hypothetical protein
MRIKAITIENFKSISEPVRIEFKPLTLLFGPNSSGKSTVIQALHYIREVLEFRRLDVDKTISGGEFIDLGGLDNFVHGHDTDRRVSFVIELHDVDHNKYDWRNHDGAYDDDGYSDKLLEIIDSSGNKHLWFSIAKIGDEVCIGGWEICLNDKVILSGVRNGELFYQLKDTFVEESDVPRRLMLKAFHDSLNSESRSLAPVLLENLLQTSSACTNPLPEYGTTSPYDSWKPDGFGADNLAYDFAERSIIGTIVDELRAMLYVGPLRTIPPRNYSPQKTFAPSRWSDGLAAWDRASFANETIIKDANKWLGEKCLDTGYALKSKWYITFGNDIQQLMQEPANLPESQLIELIKQLNRGKGRKVVLVQSRNDLEVSLCDVGVGISQTFPVVMAALDKEAKIVIIEQPELHIHPRLQVELGDLFIEAIQKGKCMIIETHSEHLLLRLLRRIREVTENEFPKGIKGLTPEQVHVYYNEIVEGSLKGTLMEISTDGDFNNRWPNGFFAERAKELF